MSNITLPPSTPRPTEPVRKFKVKSYSRKLLLKTLGDDPQYGWANNRYAKASCAIPLRLFLENLMSAVKSSGLDADTLVVSRGAAHSSILIEQRIFTESENQYMERYSDYERAVDEHKRWDALSATEKKKAMKELKRQRRLVDLQKRKDALKVELNYISDEINQVVSHA